MKLFFILLLVVPFFCSSQEVLRDFIDINMNAQGVECGTWKVVDSVIEWKTIDTVGNYFKNKKNKYYIVNEHNWIYDKEKCINCMDRIGSLVYCPCGCPQENIYVQYRVNKFNGIRQQKTRIQYGYYVQPTKSEYEITIDSLNNKP